MLLRFFSLTLLLLVVSCSAQQSVKVVEPLGQIDSVVLYASRVFDGYQMLNDTAVVIKNGRIDFVGEPNSPATIGLPRIDFIGGTLLPGFIESHAHLNFKRVPADVVLRHGVTTVRDLGGPVHQMLEGKGRLRILTSGPILTSPGGYPISVMGDNNIAVAINSEKHARKIVRSLIEQGAAVIKIALEPGGEKGAPWSMSGGHHHFSAKHKHHQSTRWPLLSLATVKAIVSEAHLHGKKVTAHIGEKEGAKIALDAGVDEWSHIPCDKIPDELLRQVVQNGVAVVSTYDTLSKCLGVRNNLHKLSKMGANIIYGAEIAHVDIPWGIDAQEMVYLNRIAGISKLDVLASATSKAAINMGLPNIGTIKKGAVADLIAVDGDPLINFKTLEHPNFVMSGGKIIVQH